MITHAYDSNGVLVGQCRSNSVEQIAAWQAMGLTTKEGLEVDISLYKYINGVLTAKTAQEISDEAAAMSENAIPTLIAEQVVKYGHALTGQETELELAQLAQIQILKYAMRILLAGAIGDYGDNIADVTRAMVLAEGIRNGAITDENIIKGYAQYCQDMVDIYGGATAIMAVLNFDLQGLQTYLAPYYPAKSETEAVTDISVIGKAKQIT